VPAPPTLSTNTFMLTYQVNHASTLRMQIPDLQVETGGSINCSVSAGTDEDDLPFRLVIIYIRWVLKCELVCVFCRISGQRDFVTNDCAKNHLFLGIVRPKSIGLFLALMVKSKIR
jgi:hypothetical protein